MAPIDILILSVLVIGVQSEESSSTFVNVECKSVNVGQYGQQSMLDCVVKTSQDVKDATIRVVTWKKKGVNGTLLVFYNDRTEVQRGYTFAEPSWNDRNMNISLLITNTAVVNSGDYVCTVNTDSGDSVSSTSLRVTAKYNKPTIHSMYEKVTGDEDVILTCKSDGGYPEGQLRWFDVHDNEWKRNIQSKVEKTENGLFVLTSKLSLLKSSIFSKYTCVVYNASGGKEDEATLEIVDKQTSKGNEEKRGSDPATKIVAPVVVIGSLIVGLLLLLLLYRRRSQRDHREVRTCESDVEEGDHPCHMKMPTVSNL